MLFKFLQRVNINGEVRCTCFFPRFVLMTRHVVLVVHKWIGKPFCLRSVIICMTKSTLRSTLDKAMYSVSLVIRGIFVFVRPNY